MRILGFSKRWQKLQQPEFTTYRFKRRDIDWRIGEQVQIVYHSRGKDREVLGLAKIIHKDVYLFCPTVGYLYPTEEDAERDGFESLDQMLVWFYETYGERIFTEPINKLTLERV